MANLQQNVYTSMVTEAVAESKILLNLNGLQVVFYTTQATHELRARAYGETKIITLAQDVRHCHGFLWNAKAYVYIVKMDGSLELHVYERFDDPHPVTTLIPASIKFIYVHALTHENNFLLALDDGATLYLWTDNNLDFSHAIKQSVYANIRNPEVYVNRPTVGVHPSDYRKAPVASLATLGVQVQTVATGESDVGFFPVTVTLV